MDEFEKKLYERACEYLRVCFEQATRLSENENIYDDEDNSIPVDEIKDFLEE